MTTQVGSQYYFDANALFKYYQDEKGSLRIRRLVARTPHPILVSELTLLECFGIAVKRHRQKRLKKKVIRKMLKHLRKDVCAQVRPFTLIFMSDGLFHLAENILLQYALTFDIGSNDALHLAIVKKLPFEAKVFLQKTLASNTLFSYPSHIGQFNAKCL
ncbi:MAG: type II toxin-antitoxin system VapC family toxin [Thiomargarita sp.]|nr:type II toxin-antitoxin system VapC family toxin [Thiomargarita sp.]